MRCSGDGILEKKLYTVLQCTDMVSLLRVLSILYVSICIPMRWLAGNCGNLEEYGFGVADMPKALDLMDDAFEKVSIDGNLLLDEDFMMGIFDPLVRTMPPFEEYLNYIFDGKTSSPVGSRSEEDKIFPFHLLKTELFCATRRDIL